MSFNNEKKKKIVCFLRKKSFFLWDLFSSTIIPKLERLGVSVRNIMITISARKMIICILQYLS